MSIASSLAARLSASFAAVLLLLLATAGVALWQMRNADRASEAISGNYLPSIRGLGEMVGSLNRMRRVEFSIVAFTDPAKQAGYRTDIEDAVRMFEAAAAGYARLPMVDAEAVLWKEVSGGWPAYLAQLWRTAELASAGKGAEAMASIAAGRSGFLALEKAVIGLAEINDREAARARDEEAAAVARGYLITAVAAGIAMAVGIILAAMLSRRITGPVNAVRESLLAIAGGDLTRRVATTGRDEIGQMAEALNRTIDGLRGTVGGITQGAQGVAGAAEELSAVSNQLTGNSATAASQSEQSSAAATEVAASIATIAAGVEELGSSVGEIAKNAGEAASVGKEGVAAAGEADQAMARLAAASAEIGGIVKLISGISEQTNLLALNATIEAARAGDAGRGFAVVASEVKDLARKTGEATADIGSRIAGIQSESQAAQTALRRIRDIVDRINALQQSIASAVEEQSATTRELAGNISQVAQAGTGIAGNAAAVAAAAKESATGAAESLKSAQELARLAAELRQAVAGFRI